jgi:hypothetical protein
VIKKYNFKILFPEIPNLGIAYKCMGFEITLARPYRL